MKCRLCGNQFEGGISACAACPMAPKGCEFVKCPNCGYKMQKESKFIKKVKALFGKGETE